MAAVTPRGYPYPEPTDPDKPREDIERLALTADERPGIQAMSSEERDVLTVLWEGRTIFNTTTQRIEVNRSGRAGDWVWVTHVTSSAPLPIAAGGTGNTVAPALVVNLESSSFDSPLKLSSQPGVRGVLGVTHGGTGGYNAIDARKNLGVPSRDEVGDVEIDFVRIFETALST